MTVDSRYGSLTVEDGVATMTFRRRMPYPVEAVWAALTDPEQRAAWLGESTVDGRTGGRIATVPSEPPVPPEKKRMTGRILVWDPPRVLEHDWRQDIVEDGVVRYELEPDGADTILTLTHRGLSARNAGGYIPGTHAFLDRLEAVLAGTEVPGWAQRYEEVAPAYA
ncbi:SRPBCC family protein [Amycolatopsis aidingensis]|uniref:SRPBCC family protein n=1 Tax=Amycolatopsis aidingensis TaxID=2842453 RepID=UPI001C0DC7F6|nr:SRPBCC family protein [Amycolatopsis aidingensis]